MSNEKISELPGGSPAQPGDAIPIARSGSNFSIAVSDIGGSGGGTGGINMTLGGNTAGVLSLISTGTLFLAGGNNVTLSQNGNSVTISANTAAAANISISAGTTSGAFGGITLGNANNISFGLNNGTITATASQSVQTGGLYILGNTTGQSSSSTYDARSLSISAVGFGSIGLSNGSIILSNPATQFIGAGISTGGNTAGISGLQSQQIVFVGGNNITLSGSAAGGSGTVSIIAPTQSNQTIGLYGSSQTYGQSSSSTYDARSLTLVGQGNIQIGQSGASIFISGASNSGASGSIYALGNTTAQSSISGYALSSLNISAAGILSGGWSAGTFVISAPGSTGISQSMYAVSNTTQSTSGTQTIGQLSFAGAGNVSVGVSNGSIVISGAGGGGGGGVALAASNTTFTSGTVVLSAAGGAITISSGAQSALFSVPATSSLSATGNASISVNASTISIGANAAAISIGGNSTSAGAGYSNVSSGTLVLAGGNNITLSQNGASVTISAGAGGGNVASVGVSTGGGTSGNTGTYSGQVVFAGGNNITLSVSSGAAGAQTITISGANLGGAQTGISSIVVSNTTYTSGAVSFSNANGISFGSSAGQAITASYTVPSQASLFALGNTTQNSSSVLPFNALSFDGLGEISVGFSNGSIQLSAPPSSIGVSTGGGTSGNTGIYSGQVIFAGGNNITLSVSSAAGGAQTITISGANAGGAQTGISSLIVSNTTYTSGAVSFSNANGATFGSSAGQAITLSYTVPTQASFFALGNTTQNSSSVLSFSALSFDGLGGNTVGYSNGSIQISGVTTAGLISAFKVSGGASSVSATALTFSNSNNVTFGLSTGASAGTMTASYALNVSAAGGTSNALSGITFSNLNGISFGLSTGAGVGTLTASVPATSSISGTGFLSVSVNGSTISLGVPGTTESVWVPYFGSQTPVQIGNGTIQIFPANMDLNFSASRADIYASVSGATIALSTYAGTFSAYVGIYTRNASTLSLASSGSQSYSFSNSSNLNTTAFTGVRNLSVPINVNGSPQDAWIAVMTQTASANTNAWTASNLMIPGNAAPLAGLIGSSANASQQQILGLGVFSVSSAALPSSIAFNAIQGTGSAAAMIPAIAFHNVTA